MISAILDVGQSIYLVYTIGLAFNIYDDCISATQSIPTFIQFIRRVKE